MKHRLVAEFAGTFGIVVAPVLLAASAPTLEAGAWVSGLIVMAMIYTFGPISKAHFNPAVTLAFATAGRFPWRQVLPYWGAQFGGAALAAAIGGVLGRSGAGVHLPTVAPGRAVLIEALAAFLLMITIMAAATDRRSHAATGGLAIGMAVVVGVWIAGPFSGGSMNPARSLGPALVAGGDALRTVWIYSLGPCLGTIAGALVYEAARGGSEWVTPGHEEGVKGETP